MSISAEQPFRVLVVDDNQDAAKILSLLLRKCGHDVQTAHTGVEALNVAEDFLPECIISDIGMPGLDGYELARRFRSHQRFNETPLIALTAYTDFEKVREAGFDHHLVKPANMAAISAILAEVRILKSKLAVMQEAAEAQTAATGALKDLVHEVKDDVRNVEAGLKEDLADLTSDLKEKVQELREELREVQEEVQEIKEELKQVQEDCE